MKKQTIIIILKLISSLLLIGLIFMHVQTANISKTAFIVWSSLTFFLFVLCDLFFEAKPIGLKGLQLYMSIMFFIIAIFEMHHVVSSICAASIFILPRVIDELK